jgi:predicted phage tail protein
MGSWGLPKIAAGALGLALVVFFAGTTAAVAAGANTPTALWAAGGAISGGLLGLLLPDPAPKSVRDAAISAKTAALASPTPPPTAADPALVEAGAKSTRFVASVP